jgi:hypothetical protein
MNNIIMAIGTKRPSIKAKSKGSRSARPIAKRAANHKSPRKKRGAKMSELAERKKIAKTLDVAAFNADHAQNAKSIEYWQSEE